MKLLILFGSESDQFIYTPLIKNLKENNFDVHFEVLSAHRRPHDLQKALATLDYDLVIAGAGLAAHLPGVSASLTYRPVIGIPVGAQLGGIDSLLSILQMPPSVSVLTSFVDDIKSVESFLIKLKNFNSKKWTLVENAALIDNSSWQKERDKFLALCERVNNNVSVKNLPCPESINIIALNVSNDVHNFDLELYKKSLTISLPWIDQSSASQAKDSISLYQLMKKYGGLWVGLNNFKNAFCSLIQNTKNINGKEEILSLARQGRWP